MSYYSKAGIYIYFFPNGKTYVGQSVKLGKRLQHYRRDVRNGDTRPVINAIRKYGWDNVRIEYPFSVDTKTVNDIDLSIILDALEMRYIKEYDSTYPNGYNMTGGADGTLFTPVMTKDVVDRLYNNDGSKPILLYDINGKFISEYKSISDCAYQLHLTDDEVRKYANCRKYMRGLYMVKFKKGDTVPNTIVPYSAKQKEVVNEVIVKKVVEKIVEKVKVVKVPKYKDVVIYRDRVKVKSKPVLQYDRNGIFIKEWESRAAVISQLGKQISIGVRYLSCGYYWMYKNSDESPNTLESIPKQDTHRKPYDSKYCGVIVQYDLNGNKIAEYNSINDASKQTGIKYGRIYGTIQGTIKKPDYIWKCIA